MKKITAKFASRCAETGAKIAKGEAIIYDYTTRKCYSLKSETAKNYLEDQQVCDGDAAYERAQEEAYFDNFCQRNNI